MKNSLKTLYGAALAAIVLLGHDTAMAAEEAAGHGEGGGGGGLPQFDPTYFPSQVFWLVVAFIILYIFFNKKTLPEISGVIENRQMHIQSDLDMAQRLTKQSEEVQAAYEASLGHAREEATAIILGVEDSIKEKARHAYDSFGEKAEKEIHTAEKRIEKARNEALAQINIIAADVAREAASKIVSIKADEAYIRTVVEDLHEKEKARAA